jgi:hypothetical protein
MNTSLLTIVKQIVTEQGEAILDNPKRVSAFFADLAREVPKPQKTAFIKCLEHGFVQVLKNAGEADRINHKQRLAQKLHDEEGLALNLCAESLDLLETVLFDEVSKKPEKPKPAPKSQPKTQTMAAPDTTAVKPKKPRTKSKKSPAEKSQKSTGCQDCLLRNKRNNCEYYDCSVSEAEKYDCGVRGSRELQMKLQKKEKIIETLMMFGISFAIPLVLVIVTLSPLGEILFGLNAGVIFAILSVYMATMIYIPFFIETIRGKMRRKNAKRLSL